MIDTNVTVTLNAIIVFLSLISGDPGESKQTGTMPVG